MDPPLAAHMDALDPVVPMDGPADRSCGPCEPNSTGDAADPADPADLWAAPRILWTRRVAPQAQLDPMDATVDTVRAALCTM